MRKCLDPRYLQKVPTICSSNFLLLNMYTPGCCFVCETFWMYPPSLSIWDLFCYLYDLKLKENPWNLPKFCQSCSNLTMFTTSNLILLLFLMHSNDLELERLSINWNRGQDGDLSEGREKECSTVSWNSKELKHFLNKSRWIVEHSNTCYFNLINICECHFLPW